MLWWALRTVVVWTIVGAAAFVFWENRVVILHLAGLGELPSRGATAATATPPVKPPSPTKPPSPANSLPAAVQAAPPSAPANQLVFRADRAGHFVLTVAVNGSEIRFLVDTGASLVALRPEDAKAAGIGLAGLRYSDRAATANGEIKVAPTRLREMRLGQLSIENVDAVVIDSPMPMSLLGMSFLRRLEGYEMRDGQLVISW